MKIESSHRKRLCVVAVFLCVLFCQLLVRFYTIQMIEGDKWAGAATLQHQCLVTEPCMRGSFYSNTDVKKGHPGDVQPFVIDVPKFHLFIDPNLIPEPVKGKMAFELHNFFPGIEKYEDFYKKSRSRKIASWLSREKRREIELWWDKFRSTEKIPKNGIYFSQEFKRSYPFGSLLGAVLHTVGEDNQNPTGGLELLLNSYLRGKEGKRLILRTGRHPLDTGKVLIPPENGADVYLSINHYLQAIAENELEKGVQEAGADGGWAVMIDPFNGEILALAQTPSFDPSHYSQYFNNIDLVEQTKVKAVTDCYEPGSIFKAITVAVCLKANEDLRKKGASPIFDPEEKISCKKGWFPGRARPLKDAREYSFMNMDIAIQKSGNIYMGKIIERLVERLGDDWYRCTLANLFGFGIRTGIDLPAESAGLLPTPGKLHPNGRPEWSLPTPYSLALGHNILCNSIQIARAYAILANGGYAVQPHLIRKIVKNGEIVVDNTNYRGTKQVLSKEITDRVVHSLKFVTEEGGTSRRGNIPGYSEVGKSGTAEKIIKGTYSKENNISSFVGFAPADNPRFVLIVSIDNPERKIIPGVGRNQFGGICAAPVFREISTRALQYLGVTPDDPFGYPPGNPQRNPEKAYWAKEVLELKKVFEKWNVR